jgi:hypothetical protein
VSSNDPSSSTVSKEGSSLTSRLHAGISGPVVSSQEGGVTVYNVGPPRMVYYLDSNGTIRELNNSGQYPDEVWIENASSAKDGGNTGQVADPNDAVQPTGLAVTQGIPNGKIHMSTGFRGKIQQIWLFYQANSKDITVQVRNSDEAGYWGEPTTIPVGR